MDVDEKDKKILDVLKRDSSLSIREIAKKTKIPVTTVHKRIKKLIKDKVIKKFTIEIDNKKIGKGLSAYILISAGLRLLKERKRTQYDIIQELKKSPYVEEADIVIGGADLVVKVRFKDIEELDKTLLGKIQAIEGVSETQTLMVIHGGDDL